MSILPQPAIFGAAGSLGLFGERGGLGRPTIRTQVPYMRGSASTNSNITVGLCWATECEFDWVRLVLHNSTAATWTLTAATVAPSAKLGNGYDPVLSDDTPIAFTAVPFNAAGADGLAPSPAGAATSLVVPASSATDRNAFAFSDWVPISSLPRVDGGDGRPLLMTRCHGAGAMQRGGPLATAMSTEWPNGEDQGRLIRGFWKTAGNFTASGFTSPTPASQLIVPVGIQYYARPRGGTVVAIGDSLTQGQTTDSTELYSWGHYATAAISTPSRPVAFCNGGWSGHTSAQFIANGYTYLDTLRPDILCISVWTPNDPRTLAAANDAWRAVRAIEEYAISKGCMPVLATAVPYNLTLAEDAIRKEINGRARARAADGSSLVADLDVAVTDGASPARVPAPLIASSGAHLSIAGYRQCGAAAAPVIARALSALSLRVPVQL